MPFQYPARSHERRHGPRGYADAESFRPWLRDEFSFRCVYCLVREQWGRVQRAFDLDHFVPVARAPSRRHDYDNLLYACATCNAAKGAAAMPDPCVALVDRFVRVNEDGSIVGLTANARRLIRQLGLDGPESTEFRRMWIDILALAYRYDRDLYVRLRSYPNDLPDLSKLHPPGGNDRPDGIANSHFARRKQGELPTTY